MPRYRVMFKGRELITPLDGVDTTVGFYTTRVVRAASQAQGIELAKSLVLEELKTLARSGPSSLKIVEVAEVPWFRFARRGGGFTFYLKDE